MTLRRRAGSMALRPMAPSTSSSGWKATTSMPRRRRRRASASSSAPAQARIGWSARQARAATPARHRRADDHEVERPRRAARRRWSGEWTPPSRCASPSITTGAKNPGMAHDAATASATGGRRSPRPNTTRRPSDCRTAQIHSGSAGHASGSSAPMPSEIMSVLTVPSGSSAAASAVGRAAHGRRAARARVAARSAGGARLAGRPQRRRARDRSDLRAAPAGPRPTAAGPGPGPAGRWPGSPARSEVPGDRAGRGADDDRRRAAGPTRCRRPAPPARRRGRRRRRPRRRRAPTRRAPPVTSRSTVVAARGHASWRTCEPSTASRYSSTRRWITWRGLLDAS